MLVYLIPTTLSAIAYTQDDASHVLLVSIISYRVGIPEPVSGRDAYPDCHSAIPNFHSLEPPRYSSGSSISGVSKQI